MKSQMTKLELTTKANKIFTNLRNGSIIINFDLSFVLHAEIKWGRMTSLFSGVTGHKH